MRKSNNIRQRKYGDHGVGINSIAQEQIKAEQRVIERIVALHDAGSAPGAIARQFTAEGVPTQREATFLADWYVETKGWARSSVDVILKRALAKRERERPAKEAEEARRAALAMMTPAEKEAYYKQGQSLYRDVAQERSEDEERILKIGDDPTHPDHEYIDPIRLENARIRESERKTAVALQVMGEALGLDVIPANFSEPMAWDSEDRKLGTEGERKFGGGKGDADNEIARSKVIDWLYRTDKRDAYAVLDKALAGDAQAKKEIKYLIRRLVGEIAIQRQTNLALVQRMTQADQKAREESIGRQGEISYQSPRYTTWGQPKYRHEDSEGLARVEPIGHSGCMYDLHLTMGTR